MPNEKDLLRAKVAAAGKMLARQGELKKAEQTLRERQRQREAQDSSNTNGETEPSE